MSYNGSAPPPQPAFGLFVNAKKSRGAEWYVLKVGNSRYFLWLLKRKIHLTIGKEAKKGKQIFQIDLLIIRSSKFSVIISHAGSCVQCDGRCWRCSSKSVS